MTDECKTTKSSTEESCECEETKEKCDSEAPQTCNC